MVTYKAQPGIDASGGLVPFAGTSHVYTVDRILWPEEVERFIGSLLVGSSLHVCSGKSMIGTVRVDLYEPSADVKADAAALPFRDESFTTVLCDPPYNGRFQWNHELLSELSRVAEQRIVFQHWFVPVDTRGRWRKFHRFTLTDVHVWSPRTYFGRAQLISVFDRDPLRLF